MFEQLRSLFSGTRERPRLVNRLHPTDVTISSIAVAPDDQTVAVGHDNGSIEVLQITDGAVRAQFRKSDRSVRALCFSGDGSKIAAAQWEYEVRVWSLASKHCVQMQGRTGPSLAFSPNGKHLAVGQCRGGSRAPDIEVFDVTSGNLTLTLRGHQENVVEHPLSSEVTALDFSPDGKELLSAGHDLQILRWPMPWTSGYSSLNTEGITSAPKLLRISPDGSSILSDTTLYVTNRKELHSLHLWRSREQPSEQIRVNCESYIC